MNDNLIKVIYSPAQTNKNTTIGPTGPPRISKIIPNLSLITTYSRIYKESLSIQYNGSRRSIIANILSYGLSESATMIQAGFMLIK
jgi:hypothetical protein